MQLHELDTNELRRDAIAAVENRGSAWSIANLEGRVGEAVARHEVTTDARTIERSKRHIIYYRLISVH